MGLKFWRNPGLSLAIYTYNTPLRHLEHSMEHIGSDTGMSYGDVYTAWDRPAPIKWRHTVPCSALEP